MKVFEITEGVGRITAQNQTIDVGPNQISIEAAKFGNTVDKDGRPIHNVKSITNEVAPPGEKAERMVKHIKKSYAKNGKLTPKEKSIAYATAWKAHNKKKNVKEEAPGLNVPTMTEEQLEIGRAHV